MRLFKRVLDERKGQGLVEFGLVIPIVLIFLLGIVEFGWLFNAKITLTSAAREGARAAVVSSVDQRNRAYLASVDSVAGTSGIKIKNDDDHFSLSIEQDFMNNINNVVIFIKGEVEPIVGLFFKGPVTIESRAVMRIE